MADNFADVLVGTIKTLQNKVETLEEQDTTQNLIIKKLSKDVSTIQKAMDLVLEHLRANAEDK